MIQINLLPGAARRKKRRSGFSFSLPSGGKGLPSFDRMLAFVVAAWIIGPGAIAWLYVSKTRERSELTVQIDQAVQDSTRYARLIEAANRLEARRDTIARKLQVIQQLDQDRYIWAHVLDEVSRALPEYTWLTSIAQQQGGNQPTFQIQGKTGNYYALTQFMNDLEASPFIRQVRLYTTQQESLQGKIVNQFVLEATYETPSPEYIETVPLISGTGANANSEPEKGNGTPSQ
ncbi:MAG TPA: PilN domain-containing protein [Longimicrobiales bacterium]|nr:PilN domain-containing protein [Longimicrobiales bacterium]